jgi:hypothetical protein
MTIISLDRSPTKIADIPNEARPDITKTITGKINHTISKFGNIIIILFSVLSKNKNIVTTIATTIGTNIKTDQRSLKPINNKLEPPREKIICTCVGAKYY